MRRVLKVALATAAIGLGIAGAPAHAATATPSTDPCNYAVITNAIACVGYYGGNLLTGAAGSATTSTEQSYINQLLSGPATSSGSGYSPPYNGLSTGSVLGALAGSTGTSGSSYTYNFSPLLLSGLTVFAAHFGNSPYSNSNDVTAFWLLNLGSTPTSSVTIANGGGVSDAQIFATGGPSALPEPATWAMMLLGFGAMGWSMRNGRSRAPRLMQLA